MATYFHGNNNSDQSGGADGLQTLVLMNPTYIQYSDTTQQQPPPSHSSTGNLVFLNSTTTNNNSYSPHAPPSHTQQFVGIPLTTNSQDINNQHSIHAHHDVPSLHGFLPHMQYNQWNSIDTNAAARETPRAQQGLSLSLSSQPARFVSFREGGAMPGGGSPSPSPGSGVTNNNNGGSNSGIHSVVVSSKYLRAAHELLEEVVNVNSGIELGKKSVGREKNKVIGESSGGDGSIIGGGEGSGKRSIELSTSERQEIQMKKAKLINMLDEVEQRYRQYHHQMEVVVSSFEQVAGIGSARTYTALALQTISKQFRCLKDAIAGQIRATNKSLGEDDCFGVKIEGSRLKYVDHQLRQQRALQQLGMIQHNAWRPQRGLPERSVSVLRAWLFEHFLHPYPKDSDKLMLAKQTGLTRSQVSNWFINARVRLWKPMVEEMYLEEMKENELNGSEDKSSKSNEDSSMKIASPQDRVLTSETDVKGYNSTQEVSISQDTSPIISVSKRQQTSPLGGNVRNQSGFSFIGSSELEGIAQGSPKKSRNHELMHSSNSFPLVNMDVKHNEGNNEEISMKFGDERHSRDGYSFMGNQTNFIGGFGQYPIGDIGRFDSEQFTTPRFSSNGVSLTLGLDSIQGTHQTFLPNQNIQLGRSLDISEQNEFGSINTSSPHSTGPFESINMQNPKRFAAQLLPDFVS